MRSSTNSPPRPARPPASPRGSARRRPATARSSDVQHSAVPASYKLPHQTAQPAAGHRPVPRSKEAVIERFERAGKRAVAHLFGVNGVALRFGVGVGVGGLC